MNPGAPDPLSDFYRAGLTVQGGFRLNRSGSLFVKGEMWSVLASIRGGSRWESGAFAEGLTGAGALALGYQIDDVVRLAVGAVVGSRLDRGGVKVSPVGSLKWHVSDRVTVRNRGRGLQVEYAPNRKLKVFAAGFFDDDAFRLDSRPGLPDDLTFRDDTIQAGLGFDWKLSKHFRINFEGGAVAWREIRLKSNDLGTLFKETGSPGAYLDLRLEMRP